MRRSAFIAATLLAITAASPSFAWDDRGHEIIGKIAANYLTPAVRKQVEAMLNADTDTLTAHDIAAAATWADKYRDSATPAHYSATADWHFADIYANRPNIPEACGGQQPLTPGTPASKGPAAACIIDKIDQFRAELADRSTPAAERLIALKYLLHLVGDAHAPLHVADMHNQHGKIILVAAEDKTVTPGTVFGYWDSALVRRLGSSQDEVAKALIAKITPADVALWSGQVTHIWALEAHQLGVDFAYGTMLSRFEDGRFIIPPAELDRGKTIVATQLSKAGVRLAALLNETLGAKSGLALASTAPSSNPAAGKAIAVAMCAVCHIVDTRGERGPSFTMAPDFVAISNTARMSPAVLRSFLTGPHPTMPQLKLNEAQIREITGYIMSLHN